MTLPLAGARGRVIVIVRDLSAYFGMITVSMT